MWYILHMFGYLDRFNRLFKTVSKDVQAHMLEFVPLKRELNSLYSRDAGIFVGYAFVRVDPANVREFNDALFNRNIGMILKNSGSKYFLPLTPEEVEWVTNLAKGGTKTGHDMEHIVPGAAVRITEGPFEGMEGVVDSLAGQVINVRVPLRKSVSVAKCSPDAIEVI